MHDIGIHEKTSVPDSDEIELGLIIGELLDHKKLIISITGIFTIIAILYVLFPHPFIRLMRWYRLSKSKEMSCWKI